MERSPVGEEDRMTVEGRAVGGMTLRINANIMRYVRTNMENHSLLYVNRILLSSPSHSSHSTAADASQSGPCPISSHCPSNCTESLVERPKRLQGDEGWESQLQPVFQFHSYALLAECQRPRCVESLQLMRTWANWTSPLLCLLWNDNSGLVIKQIDSTKEIEAVKWCGRDRIPLEMAWPGLV